jgi:colicin import membrane protein
MGSIYFLLIKMTEFHQNIPKEPGRKSALILAGLMHALLFLFLWIGIHWQSKTPVGVEAEIWDMNTRTAAPLPTPTREVPPPPEVKRKEPEPVVKDQEQVRDAEIALERAREKKKLEQKLLEEKEAKRKEEQQKQEEKQKRLDELQKEEKKKQDLAKIAEQKKADALIQQQRSDNLKRLASQVGGTGDAVKSTGNLSVDPGYAGRIAAKIKSNMVYVGTDSGPDNPTADFVINLFPDGSLKGPPRKTKSSGVSAFDDAVERAITKSAPYPADKSGNVPSTIPLTYRLKD